jgi:hypothetical protein
MPTYRNDTANTIVENFQDQHGAEVSFRIESGKTLRTEFVLTNANLTLVSEAPYYNPLQASIQTATSTGVGDDKTVQIELITKTISILNQSDAVVTVFLRSLSNIPGLNCYPWTERIIQVGHNVNQLVLQFSAVGTVYVEQRK